MSFTAAAKIEAGEPIVFAGAASLHRRAAFEAADYLMDRLKTEAVFWKREVGEDGRAGSSRPRPTMPTGSAGAEGMAGID